MSYKWFKHWQNEHPNTVILIENRAGYLSYEESAFAVCRLTSQPLFVPERRERVKGLAISVPRKEFPALLDRLMRCRVSYLVAREDYLVYQKAYDERYYQIYAAPIATIEEAEACRFDRPVGVDDRVTVKNLETRKACIWTLVPDEEADDAKREKSGNLSADSVVGSQLIGRFSGEDVLVTEEDGEVVTYRIHLAIDRDGHKLKRHRRPTAIADEEDENEAEAAAAEETEAEETPVEEAAADEADVSEADEIGEADEADEADETEDAQAGESEEIDGEVEDVIAEEVAEETEASAEIAEESETPAEEPAEPEAAAEEAWEESNSGTPFFRRIKIMLPADGEAQHFATPDHPVPPELLEAGKRQKARHFRVGGWFGKKDK